MNRGLLTIVTKRWHSDYNAFHMLLGEMTISLKGAYQIFMISSMGYLVYYDQAPSGTTFRDVFGDDNIKDDSVSLFHMLQYEPFLIMLVILIDGCPMAMGLYYSRYDRKDTYIFMGELHIIPLLSWFTLGGVFRCSFIFNKGSITIDMDMGASSH